MSQDITGATPHLTDNFELEDTFVVEDDFSYFCMWDDLMGVVSSRNIELPAIADSCYVDVSEVFPLF